MKYNDDCIDERLVSPLVVKEDYMLMGEHNGTIHVESGKFTLLGTLKGTLDIQECVIAEIIGKQMGTVSVDAGGCVTVQGAIEGTASLARGSKLVIEETGKLAGTLNNNGKVILRGVFGGARSGNGEFIIEGNGYIKQPVVRDGISYYQW